MILLDDDLASLVNGITLSIHMMDNLRKTIICLAASNVIELLPFITTCLFGLPSPLSNFFLVILWAMNEGVPVYELFYESPSLDIMTG